MSGETAAITRNPMRNIMIGKVVVNIGVGTSGEKLQKATRVLEALTGMKPCPRVARDTIREFGVRQGENIGVIVTLRGSKSLEFLKRCLEAVRRQLKRSSFDNYGNLSFGIREHIDIPGSSYDPDLGIFGLDVCVTLVRPGYRVMRRRQQESKIPRRHRVNRDEAAKFMQQTFGLQVVE